MNKIKAVIIDNGVYKKGVEQYAFNQDNVMESVDFDSWIYNHGTTCYEIFQSIAKGTKLISIQAGDSDSQGRMNSDNLITALEWCLENEVDLITISIGTSNVVEFDKYEKVLNELIKRKVIIIAAINNENKLTFPASKKGILGVCYDKQKLFPAGKFVFLSNDILGTDIIVNPDISPEVMKKVAEKESNSFATPFMAAMICNFMKDEKVDREAVWNWLHETSIPFSSFKFALNNRNTCLENLIEEPIQIAILSENNDLHDLGKWFREENYVALDFIISSEVVLKNTGVVMESQDWKKQYETLCSSTKPDLNIWYVTNDSFLKNNNLLFDVVVKEDGKKFHDEITLLGVDGESLTFPKEKMTLSYVYKELKDLLT